MLKSKLMKTNFCLFLGSFCKCFGYSDKYIFTETQFIGRSWPTPVSFPFANNKKDDNINPLSEGDRKSWNRPHVWPYQYQYLLRLTIWYLNCLNWNERPIPWFSVTFWQWIYIVLFVVGKGNSDWSRSTPPNELGFG